MAGSSFAVGVGFVSRWFSMEKQGSALGVYGLGNIGQSAAVFLGPVVAAAYGFRCVYWGHGGHPAGLGGSVCGIRQKRKRDGPPQELGRNAGRARAANLWLGRSRDSIFLTFGGFVAFSIYLPTLLRDQFGFGLPTLVFVLRDLWCWRHYAARLAVGWRTRSAARVCFPGFCRRSLALDCCSACLQCCRLPSGLWERGLARHRQWRCVSARASIFPNSACDSYRIGRRDGWHGRILSAIACWACFVTS